MENTPKLKTEYKADWEGILREALTVPGVALKAFRAFHNYSFGNQLLALSQCHARGLKVGPLGSYNRWRDLGRQVKRGEKALSLWMPITLTRTKKNEDGTEEEVVKGRIFVFRNRWFVLSQTEGPDLPEEPTPGWDRKQALEALNIPEIPFAEVNGNCLGYCTPGVGVAVNPLAPDKTATLVHEIAHYLLHGPAGDSSIPKDVRELEAEAVALLVRDTLELGGNEHSRAYIQNWYKANTIPEKSAHRILRTADEIIKAGLLDGSEEVE